MSIYSYTFCVEAQQHDQITLATMTTYIPGRHIQQGRQVQGRILQSSPRHRVLRRIHVGQGSAAQLHPEAPRDLCKPITSKSAHPATNDHNINRSNGCIIPDVDDPTYRYRQGAPGHRDVALLRVDLATGQLRDIDRSMHHTEAARSPF